MYGLGSEPPCPWQCRQRDGWSGRCRLRGEAREGREAIILSFVVTQMTQLLTQRACLGQSYSIPRYACEMGGHRKSAGKLTLNT